MTHASPPLQKIVFYDLLSNVPEKSLSPYTPVTHWSLIIKKLPYERTLVEFADVASVGEKVGFDKTVGYNGEPMYTLPAIEDPNTGSKVSDSFDIAEYLDKTYRDGRPLLVPPGTRTLQKAFLTALSRSSPLLPLLILPVIFPKATEYSQGYIRRTREHLFGKKIEEMELHGEEKVKAWAEIKKDFDGYNSWFGFDASEEYPYIMGKSPVLADIYLAARLYFFRAAYGKDSEEWKDIASWHNGRWDRVLRRLLDDYPLP